MNYQLFSFYLDKNLNIKSAFTDPCWQICKPVRLSNYDGNPAGENLETEVFSLWTKEYLYFRFEGRYQNLFMPPEDTPILSNGQTDELWDISDVLEVFVGSDARFSKKYKEFEVSPDSRWVEVSLDYSSGERKNNFFSSPNFKVISQIDESHKIWTAIFKIPFSIFKQTPSQDDVWHTNFYRVSGKPENREYLAWSPVHEIAFHQPDKFGDLIFK